jgi:transposase
MPRGDDDEKHSESTSERTSTGKRRSGKTRKGSKWLDWALEEQRWRRSAPRTPTSLPNMPACGPRRGHKKALGAVKHSIICICWQMLTTGELYTDLGGDYFRKRDPESLTKRLIAQLESLGRERC